MAILETLGALGVALLPAVGRSVAGWFEKAVSDLSDGGRTITRFEWAELGQTVVRVGFYTAIIFFGWDAYAGNADGVAAGAAAVLLDLFKSMLKTKEEKSNITTL